jgi:hypothetical protein
MDLEPGSSEREGRVAPPFETRQPETGHSRRALSSVWHFLIFFFACGCATLPADQTQVPVYRAPLDGPPSRRAMPEGCRLLTTSSPVSMTELEMEGQKDPYQIQRSRARSDGANVLLVLSKTIIGRRDLECPGALRITDCPPGSGAWLRVVFQNYACTPEALRTLQAEQAVNHASSRDARP